MSDDTDYKAWCAMWPNSLDAQAERQKPKRCSICKGLYTGWGNNAEPINAGRCCDSCNSVSVIPRRILNMVMRTEAANEQDT